MKCSSHCSCVCHLKYCNITWRAWLQNFKAPHCVCTHQYTAKSSYDSWTWFHDSVAFIHAQKLMFNNSEMLSTLNVNKQHFCWLLSKLHPELYRVIQRYCRNTGVRFIINLLRRVHSPNSSSLKQPEKQGVKYWRNTTESQNTCLSLMDSTSLYNCCFHGLMFKINQKRS